VSLVQRAITILLSKLRYEVQPFPDIGTISFFKFNQIAVGRNSELKIQESLGIPTRWNTSRRALILACGPVLGDRMREYVWGT